MSYVADTWYHGAIIDAELVEASTGSLGISITIEGPNGPVEGVMWLTDAAYPKTIAKFEKWGLKPSDWMDPDFSATPGRWLIGKIASFTVEVKTVTGQDGIGRTIVRAALIGAGGWRRTAEPVTIAMAQALFKYRGTGPAADPAPDPADAPWPKDDDLPF